LAATLNRRSSAASSASASSTSTSSIYASLTSPTSCALLSVVSMASSLTHNSLVSLSIALLATGNPTHLLGDIVLTLLITLLLISTYSSPYIIHLCTCSDTTPGANPLPSKGFPGLLVLDC